jgi:GLPGLI family protein
MKKIFALLFICLVGAFALQAKKNKDNSDDEKKRPVFSGVISYYGKVTRIPDKSKTKAKLGDFDSLFKLYMNKNFTKRVENYEGLSITITEGINQDIYFQTVSSRQGGNYLVVATPQEQKDYQLTAANVRYTTMKLKEVSGKKRINGYTCKKVVCDMVTEEKIRVQLIAWYTDELYIPHYKIPFFGELNGIPLMYDTYNGEHVVTYNATDIDKHDYPDNFFGKPSGVEPMTMTEYMRSMEQAPQE